MAFKLHKLHGLKLQYQTQNAYVLIRAGSNLDSQNFKQILVLFFTQINDCSHAVGNELEAVFKIDVISFFVPKARQSSLGKAICTGRKRNPLFGILYILMNVSKLSTSSLLSAVISILSIFGISILWFQSCFPFTCLYLSYSSCNYPILTVVLC